MSDDSYGMLSIVTAEDSPAASPCDRLSMSFSSVATSLGPEAFASPPPFVVKASDVFYEDEEDDRAVQTLWTDSDEEADQLDEEALAAEAEARRRMNLVHGPTRANLVADSQRLQALRQNQLNDFVLRQSKATQVNRQDHHIMLRQLIGEAFRRDPDRRANRAEWKRIVAAIRKEYWGANAIFTLSPDPYHNVLAKLSSMMIWDADVRHWQYTYNDSELTRRRERQMEVLAQLQSSGKLFL